MRIAKFEIKLALAMNLGHRSMSSSTVTVVNISYPGVQIIINALV